MGCSNSAETNGKEEQVKTPNRKRDSPRGNGSGHTKKKPRLAANGQRQKKEKEKEEEGTEGRSSQPRKEEKEKRALMPSAVGREEGEKESTGRKKKPQHQKEEEKKPERKASANPVAIHVAAAIRDGTFRPPPSRRAPNMPADTDTTGTVAALSREGTDVSNSNSSNDLFLLASARNPLQPPPPPTTVPFREFDGNQSSDDEAVHGNDPARVSAGEEGGEGSISDGGSPPAASLSTAAPTP